MIILGGVYYYCKTIYKQLKSAVFLITKLLFLFAMHNHQTNTFIITHCVIQVGLDEPEEADIHWLVIWRDSYTLLSKIKSI